MIPNQPHDSGMQSPPPGRNQPSVHLAATRAPSQIPLIGASAIAIILGIVAIVIATTNGGISDATTSATGVDQATADTRMCAASQSANNATAAASASWASAAANKAQLSDAIAAYNSAIAVVLSASPGTSPEVQTATTAWVQTVQKQMAGSSNGSEVDAASKRLKDAACK